MKSIFNLRKIWYSLSSNQRFFIRRLYYFPKDTWDLISGKRHKYVPPRGYIYTGSPANAQDYLEQGLNQVRLLTEYAGLKPDHRVLDIGSGIGRTAIALTGFLNENGSYEGFDVVKTGVTWCNTRIHRDFPNFNFRYVPLFNDLYNTATLKATDFTSLKKKTHLISLFPFLFLPICKSRKSNTILSKFTVFLNRMACVFLHSSYTINLLKILWPIIGRSHFQSKKMGIAL